jgi:hypothetical protein
MQRLKKILTRNYCVSNESMHMHVRWYTVDVKQAYRGFDKLIGICAGTDNHGDGHGLGSRSLACDAPFGLLGKERRFEESSRRHCF